MPGKAIKRTWQATFKEDLVVVKLNRAGGSGELLLEKIRPMSQHGCEEQRSSVR